MSAPSSSKPRVAKDYDKLDAAVKEQIKLAYPYGFERHLIKFKNKDGINVSALPFETEEKYYLVRMTVARAQAIIEDDEDYDEDGNLIEDVRLAYEDKYNEDDEDEDEEADAAGDPKIVELDDDMAPMMADD